MSAFVEFSWAADDSGEAGPSFRAVDQFLSGKAVPCELFLARDHALDRRVLRVLLDDSHGAGAGVTADELREVVGQSSSAHTFHGTVDVRYEIEAARVHTDTGEDPIEFMPSKLERHRWWHRW